MKRKRRRLTEREYIFRNKRIFADYNKGMPVSEMVTKYEVSQTQIYNVLNEIEAFPEKYDL